MHGAPFVLRRSDHIADRYGIAFAAGDLVYGTVSRLVNNRFRAIRIDTISVTTHAVDPFQEWTLKKAQVRRAGQWMSLRAVHRVQAGATLHLRAKLVQTGRLGPVRYVPVQLHVPASARGRGELHVAGGEEFGFGQSEPHSFAGLLAILRHTPRNASVVASLDLQRSKGRHPTVRHAVPVGRATTGAASGQIRVIAPVHAAG